MFRIPKPEPDEHLPYYGKYIALVGDDAMAALRSQAATTPRLLSGVNESRALFRYAPGKWSVKEVLGHVIDGERVFGHRALRFAREDRTPLPGFDENTWVPAARFDSRPLADLVADYVAVRTATLALFSSFDEATLLRRGIANGAEVSVRALAHIIAGHELHHVSLLRERYGLA
ncbi:MAG TPA: DinB family protein [Candidatus Eisenbacteria bacterium]|jgi:hypothetical protein